jgi:hypothetical protein
MNNTHDVDVNLREVLAVAIAALLFISDGHELLIPDLQVPVVERGRGSKRQRALKQLDEQNQPIVGWDLATRSERELPTPIWVGDSGSSDTTESGSKLNFQSRTRAHMRHQPCGPGNKDRKLIFIESFTRGKHLPRRDICRALSIQRDRFRVGEFAGAAVIILKYDLWVGVGDPPLVA